jgi:hypothetical protein
MHNRPKGVERMPKKTTAEASAKDWRKEMQGATPERLAKALLRPVKEPRRKP